MAEKLTRLERTDAQPSDLPPLTPNEPNGVDFRLSIAGMFDSGEPNETSENVKPMVADLIAQKHGKQFSP